MHAGGDIVHRTSTDAPVLHSVFALKVPAQRLRPENVTTVKGEAFKNAYFTDRYARRYSIYGSSR